MPLDVLRRPASLTLPALTEWPSVTCDQGFTGRSRIDQTFAAAALEPDIVVTATLIASSGCARLHGIYSVLQRHAERRSRVHATTCHGG